MPGRGPTVVQVPAVCGGDRRGRQASTEPAHFPELSIAGAGTTEMTESRSVLRSQFGLAEDMRRELALPTSDSCEKAEREAEGL